MSMDVFLSTCSTTYMSFACKHVVVNICGHNIHTHYLKALDACVARLALVCTLCLPDQ